jgi:hypothetical protein
VAPGAAIDERPASLHYGSGASAECRFCQLIDEVDRPLPQAAAQGDFGAPAVRPLAGQFLDAASSASSQVSPRPLNFDRQSGVDWDWRDAWLVWGAEIDLMGARAATSASIGWRAQSASACRQTAAVTMVSHFSARPRSCQHDLVCVRPSERIRGNGAAPYRATLAR